MALISELRYPTRWYARVITAFLALIFFALLATATIGGFLLYGILSPPHGRSEIDTQSFPGHPEGVSFSAPSGGSREGWFFPGLKTAPTIILCHGYQSTRGDLLTLVSALQDHQYNVFLFDFAGHGSSLGFTTLGFRESRELRAAVDTVARRTDVDRSRFGFWGANLGGYAAMAEASGDLRVRAFVVESVYDRPSDMLRLEIQHSGLARVPFMGRFVPWVFYWMNYPYRHEPPLSERLAPLTSTAKLYIEASDEPELADSTHALFVHSPEPRDQILIPKGNYTAMPDNEKRVYENRIVSFFLLNLPPSGGSRR